MTDSEIALDLTPSIPHLKIKRDTTVPGWDDVDPFVYLSTETLLVDAKGEQYKNESYVGISRVDLESVHSLIGVLLQKGDEDGSAQRPPA